MRVIGLTGGVGSGKSFAAHIMQEKFGARLLIADELAHQVMEPGKPGYEKLLACFGKRILTEEGVLDRQALAKIIFHNASLRQTVNQLIHPLVKKEIETNIRDCSQESGILVLESAILFESGCDIFCDEIWYVSVPLRMRRERLAKSRGYSAEKTDAICAGQLPEEEFCRRSHRILENDGTQEVLQERIREMLESPEKRG